MSNRTCIQCKKSFPETAEHFHKSKDGFHSRCKPCRRKHEAGRKQKQREKRLSEIEKGAVDMFIASARIGGANVPHSSELLEVLMEYCGGVRGFANIYMKQFYDAAPGGAFRTKMLDTMVRLASANTAMGGAKKPLTLWSEEELETELHERLMEAAFTINAKDVQRLPLVENGNAVAGGVPPIPAVDPEPPRADAVPDNSADDDVRGVE
jgi:hypothetical protein